jgi:hypothetical protein
VANEWQTIGKRVANERLRQTSEKRAAIEWQASGKPVLDMAWNNQKRTKEKDDVDNEDGKEDEKNENEENDENDENQSENEEALELARV